MSTDREIGPVIIRFGPSNFNTMTQPQVAAAARELEGALNAASERAERAEAAIARVRAMRYVPHRTHNDWVSGHDTGYNNCLADVYRALDKKEPT